MPASRMVRPQLPLPLLAACLLLAACGGSTTGPPSEPSPPEPTTGTIEASAATTGEDPDPDGYTLTLDGGESRDVEPDGTATFEEVEEGDHELGLSGAAENCPVDGENPRTVTVVGGETASTTFDVVCRVDRIAFASDRSGQLDIWVKRTDGSSSATRLTTVDGADSHPAWSPDGSRIAFKRGHDIWVMEPDGSDATQLTDLPQGNGMDGGPRWSPDGTRIAFTRFSRETEFFDIWVVEADGATDPMQLTDSDRISREPDWSPDGSQIAFESNRAGSRDIWVMEDDGSDPTRLTDSTGIDTQPAWSPDGVRIAFEGGRSEGRGLWLIDTDDNELMQLTSTQGTHRDPTWSPDGSRIAFRRTSDGSLWTVDADGGGAGATLITDDGSNEHPSWSPDGSRIAFQSDRAGNDDIWLIDPDGENPPQLTNHPDDDRNPDWRP